MIIFLFHRQPIMSAPPGTLIGSFGHNTGGQIDVAIETFLLALDYASLGLRLWSRSMTKTRLQINDWLIILATVRLQLLITMSARLITSMIVDFDHQILMTARYSVEVATILKCGVGLHIEEVITLGGPDILTTFAQVCQAL